MLRKADAQLEADEMVAGSPTSGLEVVCQMLVAGVDGLENRSDPEAAHRALCEKHPFFAMWRRIEALEIPKPRG